MHLIRLFYKELLPPTIIQSTDETVGVQILASLQHLQNSPIILESGTPDMVECLHNSLISVATLPRLPFKSLLSDCAFPAAQGGPVFTKRGASCHAKRIRGLSFSK